MMLESKISMTEYEERFGKVGGEQAGLNEIISEESSLDSEERDILKDDGLETTSKTKPKRAARAGVDQSKDGDGESLAGQDEHNLFGPMKRQLSLSQK